LSTDTKKVMVVGAGIAGLTAAWELSRQGVQVLLVEKGPFLGGHAIQYSCKASDECLRCSACAVEKTLRSVVGSDNVSIYLGQEVATVSKNGTFSVTLKPSAAGSPKAGAKAAYSDDPVGCSVAKGYSKNNSALKTVQAQAGKPLGVDAILLATGFVPFDANVKSTYGYGRFPNVITGLEMEQIKRAHGAIVRPSDKKAPKSIAFIQCVGSRDERLGHLWCSQACCSYALRSAQSMKHRDPELAVTIFYMDIQNTNKDFNEFYTKCRNDFRFIRNIPVDVYPEEGDQVRMRYIVEEDGKPVDEKFDLLVLSVGIMPNTDNPDLAGNLGVELNSDGFFTGAGPMHRTQTKAPGVFIAGTAEGPKTIAASMAHAGQAAGAVIQFLKGGK
jgi:heterodisulfide reductase subunit A2